MRKYHLENGQDFGFARRKRAWRRRPTRSVYGWVQPFPFQDFHCRRHISRERDESDMLKQIFHNHSTPKWIVVTN